MCLKAEIETMEDLIAGARRLTEAFQNDPHRPAYHFVPPAAWMNDINGAIYWRGRYHIFYQHNPDGGFWNWMQWGHASSLDLVHWVHHPIALTPTPNGADRDGCYSGGAFVSKEGVPTFIYYGVPEGACIATGEDDLLIHWTKHSGNPVIPQPRSGELNFGTYTIHDPCAWLTKDTYYAVVNRSDPGGHGDGAFLFRSKDLARWEYAGLFYESDRLWTDADEDCAVPDFFPLSDEHMLLFCSHLQGTQYYLGRLKDERFLPRIHGRMSWPGGLLGGPRSLVGPDGQRVFLDWIRELRGQDAERASGWSGAMTLPRILSVGQDGTLLLEPAPQLEVLRMNHRTYSGLHVAANSTFAMTEVRGDCLELAVAMAPAGGQQYGVKVRCSPDGSEQTAIFYDAARSVLGVDVSASTLDRSIRYPYYRNARALERLPEEARYVGAQEAPFELKVGEPLNLRVFLDRSVLEVFANNRQCITQRIYPVRPDSVDVALFSLGGGAGIKSFEAWDMAPTHG